MKTPRRPLLFAVQLAAVGLAVVGSPHAHSPVHAPATAPAAAESSAISTLAEFSVTSTATTDYTSAASTTSTRVAGKIIDLPFTAFAQGTLVTSGLGRVDDGQGESRAFSATSNLSF